MNQSSHPPMPPRPPRPFLTPGPPQTPRNKGYISEEAKKKYTKYVVILMVVFFVAQFAIPMISSFASMPSMFKPEEVVANVANFNNSVYWNDRVIFMENSWEQNEAGGEVPLLKALTLAKNPQTEELGLSPIEYPWLLPDGNRLWIMSYYGVGYYEYGRFQILFRSDKVHDISPPFMYKSLPAALVDFEDRSALAVVDGNGWREEFEFSVNTKEIVYFEDQLRVVPIGDDLHVFLEYNGRLYYKPELPEVIDDELSGWTGVLDHASNWAAVAVDGAPTVFYVNRDGMKHYLNGLRLEEDKWEPAFRHNIPVAHNFGVLPMVEPNRFLVAGQVLPGLSHVWLFEGDRLLADYRSGDSHQMPMDYMKNVTIAQLITMALPFILVFILAPMMKTYRIVEYHHPVGRAQYASLVKRGFAALIDAVLTMGPVLAMGFMYYFDTFDIERMFSEGPAMFLPMLTYWLFAMLWFLAWVLIFSFSEGRWGTTPGKWLLGIRVLGVDLAPCGFGRAFLRNILRMADGFFSYLVGIVVAAFTEKWQRVGDLAAKTIVVDIRKSPVTPSPEERDFEFE